MLNILVLGLGSFLCMVSRRIRFVVHLRHQTGSVTPFRRDPE